MRWGGTYRLHHQESLPIKIKVSKLTSMLQRRRKLGEEEARGLYRQIVAIVAAAHGLGIVVRDLKLRQFVFADEVSPAS